MPLERVLRDGGIEIIQEHFFVFLRVLCVRSAAEHMIGQSGSKPEFMAHLFNPHFNAWRRLNDQSSHPKPADRLIQISGGRKTGDREDQKQDREPVEAGATHSSSANAKNLEGSTGRTAVISIIHKKA